MSHFLHAVGRVDGGAAIEVCDDELTKVLEAVRRTGKAGTVSIALTIKPNGDRGFEVSTKVTAKAPNVEFGKSFFYADADGRLTRKAPAEESDALVSIETRRTGA